MAKNIHALSNFYNKCEGIRLQIIPFIPQLVNSLFLSALRTTLYLWCFVLNISSLSIWIPTEQDKQADYETASLSQIPQSPQHILENW